MFFCTKLIWFKAWNAFLEIKYHFSSARSKIEDNQELIDKMPSKKKAKKGLKNIILPKKRKKVQEASNNAKLLSSEIMIKPTKVKISQVENIKKSGQKKKLENKAHRKRAEKRQHVQQSLQKAKGKQRKTR